MGVAGDKGLETGSHTHSGYALRGAGWLPVGQSSERVGSQGEQVVHMSSHPLCPASLSVGATHGHPGLSPGSSGCFLGKPLLSPFEK